MSVTSVSFQTIFNHTRHHLHQREGGNQGSRLGMMLFLYATEAVLFGVVLRVALECKECILDVFGFFFFLL